MADYSSDFQISYDGARSACTVRFRCFDTPNAVTVFGEAAAGTAVEDVLLEVRRLCLEFHRLWSFTMPESDIARINEPVGRVWVDDRTARLIAAMKSFNEAEPLFDFTVGPVSYVWKHAERVPSDAEIAAGNVVVFQTSGSDSVSMRFTIGAGDGRVLYATQDVGWVVASYLSQIDSANIYRWAEPTP